MEPLKVGQKLWYVRERNGGQPASQEEVKVINVGRKWATVRPITATTSLRDEQIHLTKLYTSSGRCYLSKNHYEERVRVERSWYEMIRRFVHTPPEGMTMEKIEQIRALTEDSPGSVSTGS
jgi:hypothetical protein